VTIARGTTLHVRLRLDGCIINQPEDVILWEAEIGTASFDVLVSATTNEGVRSGLLTVHLDGGLQIARIPIHIRVSRESVDTAKEYSPMQRIKRAFASYANEDRNEVLARIQGMQKVVPDMEVFLDVASLRAGEKWEQRLWKEIAEDDVFYLFWSAAAKASPWVEKEWRCALERRGENFIDPVPLVSPDIVRPPEELAGKHFNDWILAYRRGTGPVPT